MPPAATVLVPTHSHGRLLTFAVAGALAQTVTDIEIFIVGDGPTTETRAAAVELEQADPRVRFFDFPKGEHHGEEHRHTALEEASSEVVFYLSDDDLWFPEHVEVLLGLLDGADFVHSPGLRISPDGSMHVYPGRLEDPFWLDFLRNRGNFIPFHTAAHTMDLYRSGRGWEAPPEGTWSDVHMWRTLLAVPGCRARTGVRPTSIHLTSNRRGETSMSERMAEIEAWSRRLADRAARYEVALDAFGAAAAQLAGAEAGRRRLAGDLERVRSESAEAVARITRDTARATDEAAATAALARVDELTASVARLRARLERTRQSRTWRLRDRLLSLPVVGNAIRRVGKARFRRGAR